MAVERQPLAGKMGHVWYCIDSGSASAAAYVAALLRLHGAAYPWRVRRCSALGGRTIRLAAGGELIPTEGRVGGNSDGGSVFGEVLLSTEAAALEQYDLGLSCGWPAEIGKDWTYVDSQIAGASHSESAIAVQQYGIHPIAMGNPNWRPVYTLLNGDPQWSVLACARSCNRGKQVVMGYDLVEAMSRAMLGAIDGAALTLEEQGHWSCIYGMNRTQSQCADASVDSMIALIVQLLHYAAPGAVPCVVDRYPQGRSAPLLITGDSDDASIGDIAKYLRVVEAYKARACILVKDFSRYPSAIWDDAISSGHCLGIHPYSPDSTAVQFRNSIRDLSEHCNKHNRGKVTAVRNHRFQRIVECCGPRLASSVGAQFELNVVTGGDGSWIGSASGVALPIPFPPYANAFVKLPLQLPTILEDDIFLYGYDYCYRQYRDGDSEAVTSVLRFMKYWLLEKRRPAVVNLHPEHVGEDKQWLLDGLLQWAMANSVWMPSLAEYGDWVSSQALGQIMVGAEATQIRYVHPEGNAVRIVPLSRGESEPS